MDLGSDIRSMCSAGNSENPMTSIVYMSRFLNYFSLIIFIFFAFLCECKASPGLDWQLWQMSQGT